MNCVHVLCVVSACFWVAHSVDDPLLVTHKLFFNITIANNEIGVITIGMFGQVVPLTVRNFVALTTHLNGYGYRGTHFHWVIRGQFIQGGDIQKSGGKGGFSIYGGTFPDENFKLSHSGPGWVSMANAGEPDTNGSQFMIFVDEAEWLNGRYVVFGRVLEGIEVVRRINAVATDHEDRPKAPVRIVDCGEEPLPQYEHMYVALGRGLKITWVSSNISLVTIRNESVPGPKEAATVTWGPPTGSTTFAGAESRGACLAGRGNVVVAVVMSLSRI